MRINNVIPKEFSYLSKFNSSKNINSKSAIFKPTDYIQVPFYAYRSNFVPNISFRAIQKIDKPIDFSDTEKFSEYFENKIQRQLGVKDKEDIVKSIDKISKKTNASKELATEVLARVTQFSSYSQLDKLSSSILSSELFSDKVLKTPGLNVNEVFRYLSFSKGLFKLDFPPKDFAKSSDNVKDESIKNKDGMSLCVFDNFLVSNLKSINGSSLAEDIHLKNELYQYFNSNKLNIAIVDGWNTIIDGKEKSYTFLGASDSYVNISVAVIKEMQKTGKSLDEVLNGNIIEDIQELFGEDVKVTILKNDKILEPSVDTILENINPIIPSKNEINAIISAISEIDIDKSKEDPYFMITEKKSVFEKIVDNIKSKFTKKETENKDNVLSFIIKDPKKQKQVRKNLALYLDTMFIPYSVQTMNKDLKKKYTVIEKQVNRLGKTMDDVYYFVPNVKKSFGLVTYYFAKVNNISPDKIIKYDGIDDVKVALENKVGVILDDNLCSGESISNTVFHYNLATSEEKLPETFNLLFAPLVSLKSGKIRLEKSISIKKRENIDFLIPSKVIDYKCSMAEHISDDDKKENLDKYLGGTGYSSDSAAIFFPFNIPDNNSDFANLFSSFFFSDFKSTKLISRLLNWSYSDNYTVILKSIEKQLKQIKAKEV